MSAAAKLEEIVIPPAPLKLQLEALKELEKGTKPEDLPKAMKESGAIERALGSQAEPQEEDPMYRRYVTAVVRMESGRVDGLELWELEDIARLSTRPIRSFESWK